MTTPPLRLLSWNVAYRWACLPEQLAAVLAEAPQLIALQEVTAQTAPRWTQGLRDAGYHVTTTFDLGIDPVLLTGPRKYGQLLAARWPLTALPPTTIDAPWPERAFSAVVTTPAGPLELHTAHLPTGVDHFDEKVLTFRRLATYFQRPAVTRHLLCGDFNSPLQEGMDGSVVVAGQIRRTNGTIKDQGDGTQARAEHLVITGLAAYGMPDIFRQLNGYAEPQWSWVRQIWNKPCGGRFDHVFATRNLAPIACGYRHALREAQLSDHAPIVADFALPTQDMLTISANIPMEVA